MKNATTGNRVLAPEVMGLILALSFLLIGTMANAQNSVGIGIADPNPNAVLELVSPNSNQGFLVPRLTTAQRVTADFVNELSGQDNGLMVYDSDLESFFYWLNDQWVDLGLQDGALRAGVGIEISNGRINNAGDDDSDALNEIQDLSLTGSVLTITNNSQATPIDLSSLSGAENQSLEFVAGVLSLANDPLATLVDFSNYDDDVTDDFDGDFNNLSNIPSDLADGDQVNDADADPGNELINAASLETGNVLRISDAAGDHDVDLSSLSDSGPWASTGNVAHYSAGPVGVGTETPASELGIFSQDGVAGITLTTQNLNESSEIILGENPQGDLGMLLRYDGSDNKFQVFGLSTSTIGPHLEIGRSSRIDVNTFLHVNSSFITPSDGLTEVTGTGQTVFIPDRRFIKLTASSSGRGVHRFSGGADGREIIITNPSNFDISIQNRASALSGRIFLRDNLDFLLERNSTLHLIYDGDENAWLEISRSDNAQIIVR